MGKILKRAKKSQQLKRYITNIFLKINKIIFVLLLQPLFSIIRRIECYSEGKYSFSIDDYNWKLYFRRLMTDQRRLESTHFVMSGYGLDSFPMNDTTIGNAEKRRTKTNFSAPWHLKAPFPLFPFTESGSNKLISTQIGLAFNVYLENSSFALIAAKDAPGAKIKVLDMKLHAALAVTKGPASVPKALKTHLPYEDMHMISWVANTGARQTNSNTHHLPNTPKSAIVFVTHGDLDNQLKNPFEFLPNFLTSATVTLDGIDHESFFELEGDTGLASYASLVRVLAPEVGEFGVTSMDEMQKGTLA